MVAAPAATSAHGWRKAASPAALADRYKVWLKASSRQVAALGGFGLSDDLVDQLVGPACERVLARYLPDLSDEVEDPIVVVGSGVVVGGQLWWFDPARKAKRAAGKPAPASPPATPPAPPPAAPPEDAAPAPDLAPPTGEEAGALVRVPTLDWTARRAK